MHSIYTIENTNGSPASANEGTEAGHITAGNGQIIAQEDQVVNTNFENSSEEVKESRKIPDPYTSRELLAKALTKVAKGEDKVLLEQYKSNLRMIEGEMGNLKNLRKEIDAIKYKKSITYEGRELSVKEFEQIAYTRAEEMDSEKMF